KPDVEERVVQLSRDAQAEHDWADEVGEHRQRAAEQEEDIGAEVEGLAGGQRGTDRYQHRGGSLGGVEEAVVRGGVLPAEEVARQRGEEREDLSPAEESERAEDHESDRVMREVDEDEDRDRFEAEGDRHGLLAADVIGDPSPERAAE